MNGKRLLIALILTVFGMAPAFSAPSTGLGIFLGLSGHDHVLKSRAADNTENFDPNSRINYRSRGYSIGGEEQFMITERWAIVPTLTLSIEQTTSLVERGAERPFRSTHTFFTGVFQFRYWMDAVFAGFHVGYGWHIIKFRQTGNSTSVANNNAGLVTGFEFDPGWFGYVLYEDLNPLGEILNVKRKAGLRLVFGHRWR